jgi:3beta-hydroxy-delta5-steroid dehydrogenase/steroid delta-isomerase
MFDFVRPMFEGLGYAIPRPNIPAAPLLLLMSAWQWLHFKLGIPEPAFTPYELKKLTVSTIADSHAAARDFGYAPVKSVAEGMREAVAYYRALDKSAADNPPRPGI